MNGRSAPRVVRACSSGPFGQARGSGSVRRLASGAGALMFLWVGCGTAPGTGDPSRYSFDGGPPGDARVGRSPDAAVALEPNGPDATVLRHTCAQFGAKCGPVTDDCGTQIECGACPAGEQCDLATHRCSACPTLDCAAAGVACGTITDGCGASLDCGSCPAPLVCDKIAQACRTCTHESCQTNGCGVISDGCGGVLDCGACQLGSACENGVCVKLPAPAECAAKSTSCGWIVNKCGGSLYCGGCDTGSGCQAGACGPCAPPSCSGLFCGDAWSCGVSKHCGDCQSGDTCRSGSCCTPKACTTLPAGACGGPDGCNGNMECAACPAGTRCDFALGTCSACVPKNPCSVKCGFQPDGCGGVVNCGTGAQCIGDAGTAPPPH